MDERDELTEVNGDPASNGIGQGMAGGSNMEQALDLAGFFAAHAVWCVSDGDPLIPLGAQEFPDGSRKAVRFVDEEHIEKAAAHGRDWLKKNAEGATCSVLIYDGFVTLGEWRTDALIIEVHSYVEPPMELTMSLPYRPREDPNGFAVFKPKIMAVHGVSESVFDLWV